MHVSIKCPVLTHGHGWPCCWVSVKAERESCAAGSSLSFWFTNEFVCTAEPRSGAEENKGLSSLRSLWSPLLYYSKQSSHMIFFMFQLIWTECQRLFNNSLKQNCAVHILLWCLAIWYFNLNKCHIKLYLFINHIILNTMFQKRLLYNNQKKRINKENYIKYEMILNCAVKEI